MNRLNPPEFLGGVVEGFYGQSWTQRERLHLFAQMPALGLNTYFYAPKNDLKHRAIWREAYDTAELAAIGELVKACEHYKINFLYGLSPGLDIRFAEEADRERIKSRFGQLLQIGVQHFALLFDDLPGNMGDADRQAFASLAAAHCDVTNAILRWVRGRSANARFLFCPTPYCDRMDAAKLGGPGYLDDVGALLESEVNVLWTGPEIVSPEIPVASIERLAKRLRRKPLVWDNLFANDYDFSRCFCGPYAGRARELRKAVSGILINPNNEYPLNFIPLRTFAAWLEGQGAWQPREVYQAAVAEWLPEYATANEPLKLADLTLLTDCFYLPHEEGPEAARPLAMIERLFVEPAERWGSDYEQFRAFHVRVQNLFDRLTELRDRELFAAWSRRTWELKEELQVIDILLARKKAGDVIEQPGMLADHHPGIFRRGMLTRLKRFITVDATGAVRVRTNG